MKITKSKIRKIIRESLLTEIQKTSHQLRIKNFKDCKLQLPDGFITTKGSGEIDKISRSASAGAQIYGVPGEVCDVANDILNDNPLGTSSSRDKNKKLAKKVDAAFFPNLTSKLLRNKTAFVSNISLAETQNYSNNDKIAAIQKDSRILQGVLSEIDKEKLASPKEAKDEIIDIIDAAIPGVITSSHRSDASKKIKVYRKNKYSDEQISSAMVNEAKKIIMAVAKSNANNEEIRSFYASPTDVKREYEEYLRLVR